MKSERSKSWALRALFAVLAVAAFVLGIKLAQDAAAGKPGAAGGNYVPGVYTASADGFGGPVEVALTVGDAGGITRVSITGDAETPEVGGAAIPVLSERILQAQDAGVDAVSGATYTSQAVIQAASDAVAQAKG